MLQRFLQLLQKIRGIPSTSAEEVMMSTAVEKQTELNPELVQALNAICVEQSYTVLWCDGKPLYIITVYTDYVPVTMPDGLPGFYSAFTTMARLSRTCWDMLCTRAGQAA